MNLLVPAGIGLLGALLLAGCPHRPPATPASPPPAKAAALTTRRQQQVAEATAHAVQVAADREVRVAATAGEAAHAVETAPGADAPLPPAVLAEWGADIDRLRDDAARAHAAAGAGGGGAAPAVPAPRPAG